MNAPAARAQRRSSEIAALLARWLLGGLFIYLGVSKVLHGAEFLTFVRQQLMITNPFLSGLIAAIGPALEVFYGLLLMTGIARDAAAVVGRWWLGAVFIYMGLNKALPHPEAFLKLVREYHMVTNPALLNSIGAALPWFEVYCGVLLLAGIAVRGTALNLMAMLVPFSLVVLKRALEITAAKGIPFCAVKFDCGCGAGEVYICHKLVENATLLLLAAWSLTGQGRYLCLRFSLFRGCERACSGGSGQHHQSHPDPLPLEGGEGALPAVVGLPTRSPRGEESRGDGVGGGSEETRPSG